MASLSLLAGRTVLLIAAVTEQLPENPESAEMRHGDVILTLH